MASNQAKRSFTSTPYAPMFCIGEAPTEPGMRAKFSNPFHPSSRERITQPCQDSPAPTTTSISSPSSASFCTPVTCMCSIRPIQSRCISTFEPPPKTMSGWSGAERRAHRTSASVRTTAMRSLFASAPNVVKGPSSVLRCHAPTSAGQGTRPGAVLAETTFRF